MLFLYNIMKIRCKQCGRIFLLMLFLYNIMKVDEKETIYTKYLHNTSQFKWASRKLQEHQKFQLHSYDWKVVPIIMSHDNLASFSKYH